MAVPPPIGLMLNSLLQILPKQYRLLLPLGTLALACSATFADGTGSAEPACEQTQGSQSGCASAPDEVYPVMDKDYWLNYPRNMYRFVSAPTKWSGGEWLTAGLFVAGVGGLFAIDQDIQDWWQDDVRGDASDNLASAFEPFGHHKNALAGAAALAGFGMLIDNRKAQATGLLAVQAILLTAPLVEGLKLAGGRHRPNNSPNDAHDWEGPGFSQAQKSFASGHAAYAFTTATVIANQYKDNWLVPVGAYSVAGLTALSRVNDNKHWVSDVVVGAALGWAMGTVVTHFSPFNEDNRLTFIPMRQNDAQGVLVGYKF